MKKILLLTLISSLCFSEMMKNDYSEEIKYLDLKKFLKEIEKKLDKDIPIAESDNTILTSVKASEKTITFLYRINLNENNKKMTKKEIEEILKNKYKEQRNGYCTTPIIKEFIQKKEAKFINFLNDEKGKYLGGFSINEKDCEKLDEEVEESKEILSTTNNQRKEKI